MPDAKRFCAVCGKPTRSHPVAFDVSDNDVIGAPTLAGMVCHRCWTGDGDAADRPFEELLEEPDEALRVVDWDRMVITSVPVEKLLAGGDFG